MTTRELSLGRKGERLAARYLKGQGYRIIDRNWRCQAGEVDLVCTEGGALVFVEVKSRSNDDFLTPEAGVGHRKRKKLEKLALFYIALKGLEGLDWRLDVVSVTFRGGRRPVFEVFQDVL